LLHGTFFKGYDVRAAVLLLRFFLAGLFLKEKKMKKRNHDHHEAPSSIDLLDHGAEVFTKKMFKHSQSKAQERSGDLKKNQQEKMLAMRSRREV
jgi:hypothetical protein